MKLFTIVGFVLLAAATTPAVEPEIVWRRGTTNELSKLGELVGGSTNLQVTLTWASDGALSYQRVLAESEVLQLRSLSNRFALTPEGSGIFQTEQLCGTLWIVCGTSAPTTLELNVALSGNVFASFHRKGIFDTSKICFRNPAILQLVQSLVQKPGAVRMKPVQIRLPPPRKG